MSEQTPILTPFDNFTPAVAHPLQTPAGNLFMAKATLRKQLVELRHEAKMTQDAVAAQVDWSAIKVIRIEGGLTKPAVADVMALLVLYGLEDPEKRHEIIERARSIRKSPQAKQYDRTLSTVFGAYLQSEADADGVQTYEPNSIPDIMQTDSYAAALAAKLNPTAGEDEQAKIADLRRQRAAYMLGKHGPAMHVIIEEAALHRVIRDSEMQPGDENGAGAIALQGLKQLNTVGRQQSGEEIQPHLNPKIAIQIVPFSHGAYRHMLFSYTILSLRNPDYPTALYYSDTDTDTFTFDTPKNIEPYQTSFERLALSIPDPRHTNTMLDHLLDSAAR